MQQRRCNILSEPTPKNATPTDIGASANEGNNSLNHSLEIPDGLQESAWLRIARADSDRWAIAERDASGEVIGTAYRKRDGGKDTKFGSKRGLTLEWPLDPYAGSSATDPIYLVEGASDTAALMGLNLYVVGRSSALHGGDLLAQLLIDRHVVLLIDDDGAGRIGSAKIAQQLAVKCASVRAISPPGGAKDSRAAVIAGATRAAFQSLARAAPLIKQDIVPINGAPVLVRMCDVQVEQVDWLWPGRFALGKLTLISGDPGLGKSFVTLDMAARVSRGLAWPDAPGVATIPGGVVLLGAEDALADTVRPRLDAAGADVNRIVAIQAIESRVDKGTQRTFDLARDLLALEAAIQSVEGCRLIVIDPISAYLGGVDSHKNSDVRGLLAPLGAIAARHHVAVVAISHNNKATGGQAIHRTMGSVAFVAAARAAWLVCKDKDDPSRRLLLPIKNNNAPDLGGLAYRIESTGADGCPKVRWELGAVMMSADEALGGDLGGQSKLDDAIGFLSNNLRDGPKPTATLLAAAKEAGFSERTIDRAKSASGVRARKEAFGGPWVWELGEPVEGCQTSVEGCLTLEVGTLGKNPDES